jgi:hypothetical protein
MRKSIKMDQFTYLLHFLLVVNVVEQLLELVVKVAKKAVYIEHILVKITQKDMEVPVLLRI